MKTFLYIYDILQKTLIESFFQILIKKHVTSAVNESVLARSVIIKSSVKLTFKPKNYLY